MCTLKLGQMFRFTQVIPPTVQMTRFGTAFVQMMTVFLVVLVADATIVAQPIVGYVPEP